MLTFIFTYFEWKLLFQQPRCPNIPDTDQEFGECHATYWHTLSNFKFEGFLVMTGREEVASSLCSVFWTKSFTHSAQKGCNDFLPQKCCTFPSLSVFSLSQATDESLPETLCLMPSTLLSFPPAPELFSAVVLPNFTVRKSPENLSLLRLPFAFTLFICFLLWQVHLISKLWFPNVQVIHSFIQHMGKVPKKGASTFFKKCVVYLIGKIGR